LGITGSIIVNDDLRVSLNSVVIYDSTTQSPAHYGAPIGPFSAGAGDTLTVEAIDTFGRCRWLGRVVLYCADGSVS
jgi:hypothetical protein